MKIKSFEVAVNKGTYLWQALLLDQSADLSLVPDAGALDFGNGDLTLFDPREDGGDGVLVDGVFGLGYGEIFKFYI